MLQPVFDFIENALELVLWHGIALGELAIHPVKILSDAVGACGDELGDESVKECIPEGFLHLLVSFFEFLPEEESSRRGSSRPPA